MTLTLVLTVYLVKRVVNFSFFANILPAVISCLVSGAAMILITRATVNGYLTLFLTGLSGAIIYAVVMLTLARRKILEDVRLVIKAYTK